MPKPAKKEPVAKVNTVEALKAQAEELARQAEDAEESLREAEHRENKKQTPKQIEEKKQQDEIYQKHKKAIDRELEKCNSNFTKYKGDTTVPLEVIRRLKSYYLDRL